MRLQWESIDLTIHTNHQGETDLRRLLRFQV